MGRGNPFPWRVPWIAVVGLLQVACGGGQTDAHFPGQGATVHAVLPSVDGGEVDLLSYRGQVVVLHVFTTWSLAAEVDVVELKRVRDALPAGAVTFVGVGLDPDGARLVRPWRKAVAINWPIVLASPAFLAGESGLGRVDVVPSTYVLDGAGRLAWRHEGGLPRGELVRVVREVERGR